MYKLLFREKGTKGWSEGATFDGQMLTPEARELLVERYARNGLETKFIRVPDAAGDPR